jgi:hypothetical protein
VNRSTACRDLRRRPGRCERGIEDGTNALVGGTAKILSLRPVSVDSDVGVRVAIGVTALKHRLAN